MPIRASISRCLLLAAALAGACAAQVNPGLYSAMVWRSIGTFRGGRISATGGAMGHPGVFYAGAILGGLWKTSNAGVTWDNVTDSLPQVANVSAVAVAPSEDDTVYFGTGERGTGLYKSTDGARTWKSVALPGPAPAGAINAILIDPKDANLVLVATGGAGLLRSADGGATWTRTLPQGPPAAVSSLEWAFDNPQVVFALIARGGGRGGRGGGAGGGSTTFYKSLDEGVTWTEQTASGIPSMAGFTVAETTHSQRLYALAGRGMYRSDDGGASWRETTAAVYTASGRVYADSRNPDIVYTMGTSVYRSLDGGRTLVAFKGAPGGDDPREWWIDPVNGDRMLYGGDQGAAVTLDAGATWSPWYNQPTAQFYHIAVDNRTPYWVYGVSQDSDITATRSRGDFGQINPFDWAPAPGWETGYIAADPLHPIVYALMNFADFGRFWTDTWDSQILNPAIDRPDLRKNSEAPIVFSPQDPRVLYWTTQYVMMTKDGGMNFTAISPDLTVKSGPPAAVPPAAAAAGGTAGRGGRGGGGTISALAPSPAKAGVIWSGSTTGLVFVTQDGGLRWKDVTPANFPANAAIANLEASHFDAGAAYAVLGAGGGGGRGGGAEEPPSIYRTRDFGATWQPIVNGLPTDEPTGSFVRVVREDTQKKGLLFAGTESGVRVSFDDGDHWQSLQLNAPNTSYRDLVVHGNDLIAGTYGRSSWILDDISPLRQITAAMASQPAVLFKPGDALRLQRNNNWDTAIPPEVPHALNPPEGVIVGYYLGAQPQGDIHLDIYDAQGKRVRSYSSLPIPPLDEPPPPIAAYWLRPRLPMPATVGMHRINWDLRYDDPPTLLHDYYQVMGAIYHDTPYTPLGPMVVPGVYTLKLSVDGKTLSQTVTVREDPRVGSTPAIVAGMRSQLDLSLRATQGMALGRAGYDQAQALRTGIKQLVAGSLPTPVAAAATALDGKLSSIAGNPQATAVGGNGIRIPAGPLSFADANGVMGGLLEIVDYNSDMPPVAAQWKAYADFCGRYNANLAAWKALLAQDLPDFNALLRQNQLPPFSVSAPPAALSCAAPAAPHQ